jgi:hypothetical protein
MAFVHCFCSSICCALTLGKMRLVKVVSLTSYIWYVENGTTIYLIKQHSEAYAFMPAGGNIFRAFYCGKERVPLRLLPRSALPLARSPYLWLTLNSALDLARFLLFGAELAVIPDEDLGRNGAGLLRSPARPARNGQCRQALQAEVKRAENRRASHIRKLIAHSASMRKLTHLHLFFCLFVSFSVYFSVCLSLFLSVFLSVCLFFCRFFCLFF